MYERSTAIERRPVSRSEVLPPRDLLAIASEPPPAAPLAVPGTDYEVEMVGEDPEDGSYVMRRHGRFFSQERSRGGQRLFSVSNGTVRVHYSETDEVGPQSLEITRVGSRAFDRLVSRWEPVAGREPEQVLGETCTWQDDVAVQSTDLNFQCRIADGIALKTETGGHWGPVRHFTARRLARAPLRDEDFAPPARALHWATWGITPAP